MSSSATVESTSGRRRNRRRGRQSQPQQTGVAAAEAAEAGFDDSKVSAAESGGGTISRATPIVEALRVDAEALAVASMDEGKFVALSSSFAGNRFAVLAVAEADEVDYAAEAEPALMQQLRQQRADLQKDVLIIDAGLATRSSPHLFNLRSWAMAELARLEVRMCGSEVLATGGLVAGAASDSFDAKVGHVPGCPSGG